MIIASDGPRSRASRAQIVSFTATTAEDEVALRALYDLLHKFEKTEILVSLAESTMESNRVKGICLVVE